MWLVRSYAISGTKTLAGNNNYLEFRAGPGAYEEIRRRGFSAEQVGTILGASGGPKWLVLSQIDRVIVQKLLPALRQPVHLLGSSIGAWRFSCYGQKDPLAAIERFEREYAGQTYSPNPDIDEITVKSREILQVVLGETGAREILAHPVLRTHILTVRSRGLSKTENPTLLASSLMLAAGANLFSRRSLGLFFERALFHDQRERAPFYDARGFPMQRIALQEDNLAEAVIASGSIPMVLRGIRDIPGASPGVYRDGGIIDYHLDLPVSRPGTITLFPHFFGRIVPGWFDKNLSWRRPLPEHTDRTVLICPSQAFIERLPNGKVPDRTDFKTLTEAERLRCWSRVIKECRALADDLAEVLDADSLAARLQPL
jgi:hypothetical protein